MLNNYSFRKSSLSPCDMNVSYVKWVLEKSVPKIHFLILIFSFLDLYFVKYQIDITVIP